VDKLHLWAALSHALCLCKIQKGMIQICLGNCQTGCSRHICVVKFQPVQNLHLEEKTRLRFLAGPFSPKAHGRKSRISEPRVKYRMVTKHSWFAYLRIKWSCSGTT